jgi:hypothetical protein
VKPLLAVAGVLLVIAAALVLAPVAGNGWTSNAFHPYGDGRQSGDVGWFAYAPAAETLHLADPMAIAHRRKLEALGLVLGAVVTAGIGATRRKPSVLQGVHE